MGVSRNGPQKTKKRKYYDQSLLPCVWVLEFRWIVVRASPLKIRGFQRWVWQVPRIMHTNGPSTVSEEWNNYSYYHFTSTQPPWDARSLQGYQTGLIWFAPWLFVHAVRERECEGNVIVKGNNTTADGTVSLETMNLRESLTRLLLIKASAKLFNNIGQRRCTCVVCWVAMLDMPTKPNPTSRLYWPTMLYMCRLLNGNIGGVTKRNPTSCPYWPTMLDMCRLLNGNVGHAD